MSETLPLNADAPNVGIGYDSINGNGSGNNSVSAVVGSGMSDTVGLTVGVGVNASGEAVSGGNAGNPSKVIEGTGSSGNVGKDSDGMLGRRSREDEGGDAPGAGWMEPSKKKKPRGASSGLVRGRGGAVLKKQGPRTETPLSSSKNGLTGKPCKDAFVTPREKDSSPPETETRSEPESSHTAASTYAVATESGSGKLRAGGSSSLIAAAATGIGAGARELTDVVRGKGKGRAKTGDAKEPEVGAKTGGSALAEDKSTVVGSEKAVGSKTADGGVDCVGKRIKGVSKEEASGQESVIRFRPDFEWLKSGLCLRVQYSLSEVVSVGALLTVSVGLTRTLFCLNC